MDLVRAGPPPAHSPGRPARSSAAPPVRFRGRPRAGAGSGPWPGQMSDRAGSIVAPDRTRINTESHHRIAPARRGPASPGLQPRTTGPRRSLHTSSTTLPPPTGRGYDDCAQDTAYPLPRSGLRASVCLPIIAVAPPMSRVDADTNLLFGILPLQVGLIEPADLLDAFQRWSRDRPRRARRSSSSGVPYRRRIARRWTTW